MRRHIVLAVLILLATIPAAAQWPGVYPESLYGEQLPQSVEAEFFAVFAEMRNEPFGTPDLEEYPPFGYVGTAIAESNGHATFTLGPLVSVDTGRMIGPPLMPYGNGESVSWEPACGCYMLKDWSSGRLVFEAWTYRPDGVSTWTTGTLRSTGIPWPWYAEDVGGIWVRYDLVAVPPWLIVVATQRVAP